MSTSIFFYEPFNGFDRLFSEAFDARHKPNRCGSNDRGADAGRALRPRSAIIHYSFEVMI